MLSAEIAPIALLVHCGENRSPTSGLERACVDKPCGHSHDNHEPGDQWLDGPEQASVDYGREAEGQDGGWKGLEIG